MHVKKAGARVGCCRLDARRVHHSSPVLPIRGLTANTLQAHALELRAELSGGLHDWPCLDSPIHASSHGYKSSAPAALRHLGQTVAVPRRWRSNLVAGLACPWA